MKKQPSNLKVSGVRKPAPQKENKKAVVSKKRVPPKKSGKKAASGKSKRPRETAEDYASGQSSSVKLFPIVGIGASAGGIEAFSRLLEHLSPNLGMAYVYVQHLSPKHESFLAEILQRKTKMPVITVKDGIDLEKDKFYVMPAKFSMSVTDGRLKLEKQDKAGGSLHAIDQFLSSLAPLYQQNAIGIILSGIWFLFS
jgi:two-component system CheB/CheR fusion protein